MSYELIYRVDLGSAQSPFRVVAQPTGREVGWINRFLDQCCVRGLAWHTLRGYAFDLTHFVRWWADRHSTDEVTEQALTSSSLLDYLRYQAGQQPRPAANTINTRVWVAERALRCQFPEAVPPTAPGFQQFYWRQSKLGYGRSRPALTRLRVKAPKRVVTPLSVDEVSRFWSSFRTGRDLAIVGLMLLQGLRSCEVLALDQEDLILSEAQIRVRGKGNKVRLLPLAPEAVQLHRSLPAPGTSTSLRRSPVRVPERARPGNTHDRRGSPFAVPPSSSDDRRRQSQPSSIPAYLRHRHDPRRHQLACAHATDGTRADPDHHGLRPHHSAGCLSAIRPRRGSTGAARSAVPLMKPASASRSSSLGRGVLRRH